MTKSPALKSLFEKKQEDLQDVEEMMSTRTPEEKERISIRTPEGEAATIEVVVPKARRKRRAARDEAAYAKILTSCASVANDRQKNYGDAKKNFQETSELCAKMFGLEISPTAIVKVMIAVKWARQMHRQKHDNLIDAVNYTAILAHMTEEEGR